MANENRMKNPRLVAAITLTRFFKSGSYSEIAAAEMLFRNSFSDADKRLALRIFYGVITHKITLDYIISKYSKTPIKKLDVEILNILRIGLYQIKYCDSIPDSAAVNESVELAKKMRKSSATGFINGVLRGILRSEKDNEQSLPKEVYYSVDEDIYTEIQGNLGRRAKAFLEDSLKRPPVYIRLNSKNFTEDDIKTLNLEKNNMLQGCFLSETGSIIMTEEFENGMFYVEDLSSQMCCAALGVTSKDRVLDICAAPGGKTFTLAQTADFVLANDIYAHRVKLIKDGAKRLKLYNIETVVSDGAAQNTDYGMFDKVLCDVPCSGLGVIRRKPEIKYKSLADFAGLPTVQYAILQNAAKHVNVGGEMIYSTCTIRREENEEVAKRFLKEHSNFEGVPFFTELGKPFGSYHATLLPEHFGGDGFFIAKMRRKK
jgi:16S rRNA (cytosine967-C5)-methyltransferase